MQQSNRIEYIDGIRGIASVFVVFCHLSLVFVPWLYDIKQAKTRFDMFFLDSPLNILTNGSFPVTVFFFLSGYLITRKNYCRVNAGIKALPHFVYLKYLKLVIPAVLLPAILMLVGGMFHLQAVEMDASLQAVIDYNNFLPTITSVIKDITKETFVSYSQYNGPLWTIHYEYLGTILLTTISFYLSKIRGIHSTIAFFLFALLAVYWNITFIPFFLGGGLYNIECHLQDKKQPLVIKILLMLFGTYLACVNLNGNGIYSVFSGRPAVISICRSVGTMICLFVVNNSFTCKRILSAKPFVFLGKVSPWTYIFHWPMILSIGCWIFINLINLMDRAVVVLIVCLIVLVVSLVAAYVASIADEKMTLYIRNKRSRR